MSEKSTVSTPFTFSVSEDRGVVVIEAQGPVNSRCSPMLRDAINKAFDEDYKNVIVHLDGVNYMDSSGLATLVEGLQLAEQNNGKFVLAGTIHEKVFHLFEITRLEDLFESHPTVEAAKCALLAV